MVDPVRMSESFVEYKNLRLRYHAYQLHENETCAYSHSVTVAATAPAAKLMTTRKMTIGRKSISNTKISPLQVAIGCGVLASNELHVVVKRVVPCFVLTPFTHVNNLESELTDKPSQHHFVRSFLGCGVTLRCVAQSSETPAAQRFPNRQPGETDRLEQLAERQRRHRRYMSVHRASANWSTILATGRH